MKMVDTVTTKFVITQLKGKPNIFVCMECFGFMLLACYPHLRVTRFNNGGEFMAEFSELSIDMSLKQCPLSF